MIYSERDRELVSRLGLDIGQMSEPDFVHNGGWYISVDDHEPRKFGWGDLNPSQMDQIASRLEPGERMFILSESDSFWRFVTHNPGITGDFCETSLSEAHPGAEHVASCARFVIEPGVVRQVISRYDKIHSHGQLEYREIDYFRRSYLLKIVWISREAVCESLGVSPDLEER